MIKPFKIVGWVSVLLLISIAIVWHNAVPKQLTLRFYPFLGNKPLVLNNEKYPNPGGKGVFTIRDFQFFISNLELTNNRNHYSEQESYHLARFDVGKAYYEIIVSEISVSKFKQLVFNVGIDRKANGTIVIAGDLDPNSRMAWNWQVGYKFLLLEGSLFTQEKQQPLVYHIGFNESYTRLSFPLNSNTVSNEGIIELKVDILTLFNQAKPIDMNEIPNVKFDPEDVAKIANGFHHFISVM